MRLSHRPRLADARGFTLVELLVTMMLGLIVLGAVMSLVTASGNAGKNVRDRVDAAHRGRIALETMTQGLRTAVCLPPTVASPAGVTPWVQADGTSLTWYANLDTDSRTDANGDGDPTYDPQQRRLRYVPAERRIYEDVWDNRPPLQALPAGSRAPESSRTLAEEVTPVGATPVFRYYALPADPDASVPQAFTPGGAPTQLARVVRVEITYRAASGDPNARQSVTSLMQGSVYARNVNRTVSPSTPTPTFGCTT